MRSLVALAFAVMQVFQTALAGSATGRVDTIQAANHSPAVLFTLDAPIADTPRCNESGRFAFDLRQVGGRSMLEVLLTAKQHGYTLVVQGLNTCGTEWKSEDVKNILVR